MDNHGNAQEIRRHQHRETCVPALAENNIGIKFVDQRERDENPPPRLEQVKKIQERKVAAEFAGAVFLVDNIVFKKHPAIVRSGRDVKELEFKKLFFLYEIVKFFGNGDYRVEVPSGAAASE